jgi:hypothetical protein
VFETERVRFGNGGNATIAARDELAWLVALRCTQIRLCWTVILPARLMNPGSLLVSDFIHDAMAPWHPGRPRYGQVTGIGSAEGE